MVAEGLSSKIERQRKLEFSSQLTRFLRPTFRNNQSGILVRILHAYKIYRPDIEGGIPAAISSLAYSDKDAFHSVLSARRFGIGHRYVLDGVPVEAVTSFGTLFSTPLAPGYIPRLLWRMRSTDVLIHHAPLPLNDLAVIVGLPAHVALVVYWHADITGFPVLKRVVAPLIRQALERANRIVVSGRSMIDNSEFLRPHEHKCIVLPYGIDLDYWRSPEDTDFEKIEEQKRNFPRHVVSLGRLVGYKGYEVLIRAMCEVDGQATVIGEGPLLPPLLKLTQKLGVDDRVRLVGRQSRSQIRQLFHSAKVFAFPSVTEAEAFGFAQVEAMAAGLPIVNTSLPTSVPLVARHDIEALTVAPNDAKALAQALNRILDEPRLAERLGAAGRARALSEFDQSVYRTRMAEVYSQALPETQGIRAVRT